jgi:Uma2 family endonuclease
MPEPTRLMLGPQDDGRRLTFKAYLSAKYTLGHLYELIAGRLQVSPFPGPAEDMLRTWLTISLSEYWRANPSVVRWVTPKARVHVPKQRYPTCPEPDVTLYTEYLSRDESWEYHTWRDVSPALVAEVVTPEIPDKDHVRNVELYRQVPTIREYWILDPCVTFREPTLTVYKRGRGLSWKRPVVVPFRETYTTDLLPGFELVNDVWAYYDRRHSRRVGEAAGRTAALAPTHRGRSHENHRPWT